MSDQQAGPARTTAGRVLVVEGQAALRDTIWAACPAEAWELCFAASATEALNGVEAANALFDLVVVDVDAPEAFGVDLLGRLRAKHPTLPVLALVAAEDAGRIVECVKAGAYDCILKPLQEGGLTVAMDRALEERNPLRRCASATGDVELAASMGPSRFVADLGDQIAQVAPTRMAVLVQGETGTGKEIVARRIHALSGRPGGPFVAVDAGAIPETLLEGELFGFKKGSFTGATADREGKIVAAHGGTLFFDEIGNLPLHLQVKLLRVLQEREVTPIGASKAIPVDIRVVSATNACLEEKVRKKEFRADLFHRIAEFPILISPLRERVEDLLFLALRFLKEACGEFGKAFRGFGDAALQELIEGSWSGNAREIRSVVRRAALVGGGRVEWLVSRSTLSQSASHVCVRHIQGGAVLMAETVIRDESIRDGNVPLREIRGHLVREIDREILRLVMARVSDNLSQAARVLGVDYKTAHTKMKELKAHNTGGVAPQPNRRHVSA